MNYNKIINKIGKYHFLFVTKRKVVILSGDNEYKGAIKMTLKKIKSKISSLKNKYVVYIKLKKVTEKDIKENKKSKLKVIGGDIQAVIKIYNIDEDGDLVVDNKTMSYKVYFAKKQIYIMLLFKMY